jgi:hypothetical protein
VLIYYLITEAIMSNKELAHVLLDKVPDSKIMEVMDFMLFIYGRNKNEFDDLLSVSENTLDFWDNKEDEVWDNNSYCHNI